MQNTKNDRIALLCVIATYRSDIISATSRSCIEEYYRIQYSTEDRRYISQEINNIINSSCTSIQNKKEIINSIVPRLRTLRHDREYKGEFIQAVITLIPDSCQDSELIEIRNSIEKITGVSQKRVSLQNSENIDEKRKWIIASSSLIALLTLAFLFLLNSYLPVIQPYLDYLLLLIPTVIIAIVLLIVVVVIAIKQRKLLVLPSVIIVIIAFTISAYCLNQIKSSMAYNHSFTDNIVAIKTALENDNDTAQRNTGMALYRLTTSPRYSKYYIQLLTDFVNSSDKSFFAWSKTKYSNSGNIKELHQDYLDFCSIFPLSTLGDSFKQYIQAQDEQIIRQKETNRYNKLCAITDYNSFIREYNSFIVSYPNSRWYNAIMVKKEQLFNKKLNEISNYDEFSVLYDDFKHQFPYSDFTSELEAQQKKLNMEKLKELQGMGNE